MLLYNMDHFLWIKCKSDTNTTKNNIFISWIQILKDRYSKLEKSHLKRFSNAERVKNFRFQQSLNPLEKTWNFFNPYIKVKI